MRKQKILFILLIYFSIMGQVLSLGQAHDFFENFESFSSEDWLLQEGWSIIKDGRTSVLQGTLHSFATLRQGINTRFIELNLKIFHGTVHLNFLANSTAHGFFRYFVGLSDKGSYLKKQRGENFRDLAFGRGILPNRWHKIKIEAVRNRINVYADNIRIISFNDPDPLKEEGGISFETLENSRVFIDNVRLKVFGGLTSNQLNPNQFFPQGIHQGDILLQGKQVLTLQNGFFQQFGNIKLKQDSRLIIRNATLKITRYQKNLNHWGIELKDNAQLEVDQSKLVSDPGTLLVIYAFQQANVSMKNSPSKIHLFSIFDSSKATVYKSDLVGDLGGAVCANRTADIKIIESRIGAISITIPQNAVFEASGLRTGYFKQWSLQKNTRVSNIHYNITLQNSELVPDTMGPGPFERGWPIMIDSTAQVSIKNSELRKVVILLNNEKAQFSNFVLNKATNFFYKNITLQNVRVMGQWGVFLRGACDVIVSDSDGFWTFVHDKSRLVLKNTHMNEFDPRKFRGEIVFDNCVWDTAAEILENNDFVMRGSLRIGSIGGFSWMNSRIKRFYDVNWEKSNTLLRLRKDGKIIWQGQTNAPGTCIFPD